MSRYKIVITEITQERKIRGKEWKPVSDEPKASYDYTPEIEKMVDVTREIYAQDTAELDLKAVIKAINGL